MLQSRLTTNPHESDMIRKISFATEVEALCAVDQDQAGRARSRGERNAGISSLEKLMQNAEAKPMKKTNTAVERKAIYHHFANKTMRVKALALPLITKLRGIIGI
jgi:hypothetical protein